MIFAEICNSKLVNSLIVMTLFKYIINFLGQKFWKRGKGNITILAVETKNTYWLWFPKFFWQISAMKIIVLKGGCKPIFEDQFVLRRTIVLQIIALPFTYDL